MKDYYRILGIKPDASQSEIKDAYKKLAREWHPDINHTEGAEERFKEINEAYQVIGNPQKRRHYSSLVVLSPENIGPISDLFVKTERYVKKAHKIRAIIYLSATPVIAFASYSSFLAGRNPNVILRGEELPFYLYGIGMGIGAVLTFYGGIKDFKEYKK